MLPSKTIELLSKSLQIAPQCTRRTYIHWPEYSPSTSVTMPPNLDDRQLPTVPHTPLNHPAGVIPPIKHIRADIDMRGPERIHNQLIYRQYGIIALGGGALIGSHFDMIRARINKYVDFERFFAIWRIDPPWKAVSRRSLGKRAGGGKAKVHHYETPVKAGRIIIELAGRGEFKEIERHLVNVSNKLPIYAMPISQDMMDSLKQEYSELAERNYNPFEYRDLVRRNFSDSQRQTNPLEKHWGGTYF